MPVERADERLLASIDDYAAFYRQVEAAALEAGLGARLPAGSADYFLVVFVKDPLIQDAALAVSLAGLDREQAPGAGESPGKSHFKLYDGGWVVAGTLATLDLGAGPPLWMNVSFEPEQVKVGPDAGPRLIAAFPVTQAARDLRPASAPAAVAE